MLIGNVKPQVVNPQGILLIGRSKDFNEQQTRDFEIIKRQYKKTPVVTNKSPQKQS